MLERFKEIYKETLKWEGNDKLHNVKGDAGGWTKKRYPRNYWTYRKIQFVASWCQNKSEFRDRFGGAYMKAIREGFIDDVCSHMEIIGHKYKRFIYAFEFPDKSVYVGLTFNLSQRESQHLTNKESSVYKYIQKTGLTPFFKIITDLPIPNKEAVELEASTLTDYLNDGWKKLNSSKTGSLGGNQIKWTTSVITELAKSFKTRSEFQDNEGSAYAAATKLGILDEVCSHMNFIKYPKGYWDDKDRCKSEASKYTLRSHFKKQSNGAFEAAVRNNWVDEFFPKKI